jgi:hypothetical protein
MIKQYVFDNINDLYNFKLEIILPEIKNGRYIQNIYLKIIKEIELKINIRNIINKEFKIDINYLSLLESNNILTINFKKDYIYNLLKDMHNINKFTLIFNIDTNLDNMCIWNLEYSPYICGELIIN